MSIIGNSITLGGDMQKSVYSPNYTGELASKTDLTSHTGDSAIHVTSSDKTSWNGKSTVSVSSSGSATDEVQYITVNGVEKKLAGGSTFNGLNHNGIYRGKALGTINASNINSFLSTHEVSTGKFTDLYLGDEIVIQDGTYNATWIIAGFDTEWQKGSTSMSTHHISLIPKGTLLSAVWHASGTPQGYWNSDIRATCDTVATNLATVLSSHLLTRSILPSTAMSTTGVSMAGAGLTGYASSWGWQNAKATLLTEVQVYGATVLSSSFYDVGEGCEKLPVFNFLSPSIRAHWWLRAVASSSNACLVDRCGVADHYGFSNSSGVRPLICIG